MTLLLPKYFAFRYPAKLFIVASLCLSVLAGVSLRGNRIRLPQWLAGITIAGCVLGPVVLFSGWAMNRLSEISANELFGPLDIDSAQRGLTLTFVHSLIIAVALLLVAQWQKMAREKRDANEFGTRRPFHSVFAVALVLVSCADVLIANRWMTLEIDSGVLTRETNIAAQIEQLDSQLASTDQGPLTILRSRDNYPFPKNFAETSSSGRISEIATWQRESLMPKTHLEHGVRLLGSFTSIWPNDYETLVRQLGWDYITPLDAEMNADTGFAMPKTEFGPPIPNIWLEEDVVDQGVQTTRNEGSRTACRVVEFSHHRIRIEAENKKPARLFYFLLNDPGWKVELKEKLSGELVDFSKFEKFRYSCCGNSLVSTAPLDRPGRYAITLTYDPIEFRIGAWISALSWLGLAGFGLIALARKKRRG